MYITDVIFQWVIAGGTVAGHINGMYNIRHLAIIRPNIVLTVFGPMYIGDFESNCSVGRLED